MDPVEKLFQDLPTPEQDEAYIGEHGDWNRHRFCEVVMSVAVSRFSRSNDRDRLFIKRWVKTVKETGDADILRCMIGLFAIDKLPMPGNMSAKSRQLIYHAWIAKGRKDEDHPFKEKKPSETPQTNPTNVSHAYLPARLTDPKVCANCAAPDANHACSACLLKLDDSHVVAKTAYCNQTCQAQHWEQHKHQCHERRAFFRATSILYEIFMQFMKRAWVVQNITDISEKDGILHVTKGARQTHTVDDLLIRPFPFHKASSEEHGIAVLVDNQALMVLTTFQPLLNRLLLPICKTLEEVHIMPRNVHRPICIGQGMNNMDQVHTVLRATLKSGEQMLMDFAAPQFGWRETVAEWNTWTSHRSAGKTYPEPYGTALQTNNLLMPELAPAYLRAGEWQQGKIIKA
ncbi:hypothetical protein ONZ43_g7132 [Nemania bipapillata]|uniref:Uncharacterized protein n=1 Tax=Nemania bipapillata TaxID=110536 RepID=A0ACC2HTV8_9PEZI|nr:hypothetical protein ONZ43_g7132 [Nemania bipapillata]